MTPIYGLVLAGGRSLRMGIPKENLSYHGDPEFRRVYALLEGVTDRVYFSIRSDQRTRPEFIHSRYVVDEIENGGLLGALVSAFHQVPDVSWLLVPVDMPLLEIRDFQILIESHKTTGGITAFDNGRGGFEPLPGIYDAALASAADHRVKAGRMAIIGLGDDIEPNCIFHDDRRRLTNINTTRERERVLEAISEYRK